MSAGPVHRRPEVLLAGVDDDEIRRRCAGGTWRRVRRGVYAEQATYADLGAAERHRLLIEAAVPGLSVAAIVSHQSAAVLYGAPIPTAELGRVCVTRNRRGGGRVRTDVRVHCARVDRVVELGGLVVTAPARTIVDLARTLPFEAAVVAGDAIARRFGVSALDLEEELGTAKRRHGCTQAHRVAEFLDPHSASIGESRSRVLFRHLGLPVPYSRGEVFTTGGRLVDQVDFYFPDTGVIGLFDQHHPPRRAPTSAATNTGMTRTGTTDAAASRAAMRREESLRALGFHVVRWSAAELPSPEIGARVRAALTRTRRLNRAGYIHQAALPTPQPLTFRAL
ncbi:hypothetical protein IU501_07400 [Nocardia otitidiscaviarum]|uniref:hypothetical protein n=1 Tax=Nocardia otitidiscaviarum TaxID=1823 RepID=UPI0004A7749F|nr:hypothetical protein [Nocardia otitidiscaviarum]MBF6132828.1 hypothetical protein [Nocardia otitidiscaviarum]MBF6486223.1 hypothetical protein [Nocardia otitidiscaviarum]